MNVKPHRELKRWKTESLRHGVLAPLHRFCASKHPQQALFVTSTHLGFQVCEDYHSQRGVSELSSEKMQVTSVALSRSEHPFIAITFSAGPMLLMDPLKRKEGPTLWLNTQKNLYNSSPRLVRWAGPQEFLVCFEDNAIWVFHSELHRESEDNINLLRGKLHTQVTEQVLYAATDTGNNPTGLWKFYTGKITDFQVHNSSLLVVATADGELKICNFCSKQPLFTFYSCFAGFCCVDVSGDGTLVAAGGEDDSISVWEINEKRLLGRCEGHRSWVSGVKFQGDSLVSAGEDGTLRFWDYTAAPQLQYEQEGSADLPYPQRSNIALVPCTEVVHVSRHPLCTLDVHEGHIFVRDSSGVVTMLG